MNDKYKINDEREYSLLPKHRLQEIRCNQYTIKILKLIK